ncbi:MAG: NAD-dependent epimerase/dehydratase family protein [Flavobacterium sp.]|nr:MAG: NAD-dependent epimerase/dehydratase family protein [Flavobacterium sp.]
MMPDSESYSPEFFDCDVLWIAIPPKSRSGEGDNYIKRVKRIIAAAIKHGVKQVVHISSTGVYGDHNQEVDELTPPDPISPSGKILLQVEQLLRKQAEFITTIVRFGGLVGPSRDPGRFFAGKKNIPNGKAPVNLIHLDDCIRICAAILDKKSFGYIYNACSPHHPEKAGFYTQAAIRSGLKAPDFTDELLEWKIVRSVYIDDVLGYSFKVGDWDKYLGE